MKNINLILIAVIQIFNLSCGDILNDDEIINKEDFLVDKIYDYNNNLVGDYIYDNYNRLIKIIMHFYDTPGGRRIDYDFEYQNDKVKSIKNIHHQQPGANFTMELTYDSLGNIVKHENYKDNMLISTQYYKYFSDGKLRCLSDANGNENHFFSYDERGNAVQVRWFYVDYWFSGDTIEIFRNFLYDNMPKPNFGIDYIFQIELLPGFGNEATFEKGVSENNMIEFIGGTEWIYTYNENNLPETIETKWKNMGTSEPMLLRFNYRQNE